MFTAKVFMGEKYEEYRKEREELLEKRRRCREHFSAQYKETLKLLSKQCAELRQKHSQQIKEEMVQ